MNKKVNRQDRINLLEKVNAGKAITDEDHKRFEQFDFKNAKVWLQDYEDGSYKCVQTGEILTEEEWNERHPDKSNIITFK
jgi:hypothetical protein